MIASCPHCSTRVWIEDDGRCPSCRQQTGIFPSQELAGEHTRAAATSRPQDPGAFASPWEAADVPSAQTAGPVSDTYPCPMCGASISKQAAECDFCGEELHGIRNTFGLWRDGKDLVMHKDVELPDRCVKSNRPTRRRLKRQLNWHSAWVYLSLVLCGLIPYIMIALALRKQATVHIGLSDQWFAKRRRAMAVGWLLACIGIAPIFLALASTDGPVNGYIILGGLILPLVGAIYGVLGSRMVKARYITNEHVWMAGVHPDFLAELPDWRGLEG
jgi:hypothetical protein